MFEVSVEGWGLILDLAVSQLLGWPESRSYEGVKKKSVGYFQATCLKHFSADQCNLLIYLPPPFPCTVSSYGITESTPTVSSLSPPPNWVKEVNVW